MGDGPTQPSETFFNRGQWGHDGTDWQKLSLLWGYSGVWRERQSNLSASTGNNTLTHTTVPAGEVWRLENISVFNANTVCTYIRVYVLSAAFSYIFKQFSTPAANVPDSYPGLFTLGPGDTISVLFTGCVLNDDIYSDVVGYKMAIA